MSINNFRLQNLKKKFIKSLIINDNLKLFMVSLEFRLSSTTNLACLGILIEGSKVYQIITEM